MGQATRTTILPFNMEDRQKGGMNRAKRTALETTVAILTAARSFYIDFFLAHKDKMTEQVCYYSEKDQEQHERLISANELMAWAESCTVATKGHPHPWIGWNFSEQFVDMPSIYRRSVMKDAIGKVRSYLSNQANWQKAGKKRGRPGQPGATNHPTLYQGSWSLEVENEADQRSSFIQIKVYTGMQWTWMNYPVKYSQWHERRLHESGWKQQSPKLVVRAKQVTLHIPQVKEIAAKRIRESKLNPDLVTVAVDLNIKMLAVVTVRYRGHIIQTKFVHDHGLDQHRYRHLKRVSKRQWQSGKQVKGERNCRHLWDHIRRTNRDVAHTVARAIADICAQYPGCVLIFERLRVMRQGKGNRSHRLNRKLANQIRGMIRDLAKEKAFAIYSIVTIETNAHGTSQYCSRCGKKGERFSLKSGKQVAHKGGKLFRCRHCGLESVHADWNASVNVHHSFYREFHWQPRSKESI